MKNIPASTALLQEVLTMPTLSIKQGTVSRFVSFADNNATKEPTTLDPIGELSTCTMRSS